MKLINSAIGKLILFWLIPFHVLAQNNTVSGGGSAAGSGGSSSFSIGQIASGTISGTNGSAIQGMQQPIEITVITGAADIQINLTAKVFPNPATDFLILSIKNPQLNQYSYVLSDLHGKVFQQSRLFDSKTTIQLSRLNAGTYFLKISKGTAAVKIFKIIKSK